MRAFLAVPRDAGWAAAAEEALAPLRPALPPAAWTRPETWHLTIRFLGDVPPAGLERFAAGIAEAAAGRAALRLAAGGAARFPPRGRARVLGVALREDTGALADLAAAAEREARAIGLDPEERPYSPHVTFARLRRPWPRPAIDRFEESVARWPLPRWPATALVLVASALEANGAVHTELARFPLGARETVLS